MIEIALAQTKTANVGVNTGAWHAISSASPVVQLTLLLLVVMSVLCWAVIWNKVQQIKLAHNSDDPFLDKFWKADSLDDIFNEVDSHPHSPMAKVFRAGYLELRKMADSTLADSSNGEERPMLSSIDNLERALRKAKESELAVFESRLGLLATTGSTGPFIGLFGTVWGIMGAFQKIGQTGMASLAVVAPGISEALIATAVGLAAAIPATVAYNHFIGKVRGLELDLDNFSSDFLNIVKRNFFREH